MKILTRLEDANKDKRKIQNFFEGVSVLFALQMVEEVEHLTKESHSSIQITCRLQLEI